MGAIEAFEAYRSGVVPDPRITLCDVTVSGGALSGVAEAGLERPLYRFAAEHGIGSTVRFIDAEAYQVLKPRVFLRARPEAEAATVGEALYGEALKVYDRQGDFYRVQTVRDGYLGWAPMRDLIKRLPEATHRVIVPRGHIYVAPKVSSSRLFELSYGTSLPVTGGEEGWFEVNFAKEQKGFVNKSVLEPLSTPKLEPSSSAITAFAHRFLESPYIWGGVSAWGLDCSGLVQTVYAAHGLVLPRDADQQQACGQEVALAEVRPADLLFFPGHVAISLGGTRLLHANAKHMRVTVDDFAANDYGRYLQERLTCVKRLALVKDRTRS